MSKRGTIGAAVDRLVKKYGNGTIGLYILERALERASGVDGVQYRLGGTGNLLLYETPRYKKLNIEEAAILARLERETRPRSYAERVAALEAEGCTTSDAQAVVDAEDMKECRPGKHWWNVEQEKKGGAK